MLTGSDRSENHELFDLVARVVYSLSVGGYHFSPQHILEFSFSNRLSHKTKNTRNMFHLRAEAMSAAG